MSKSNQISLNTDPMLQTFWSGEGAGVFITKIGLFFQNKSSNLPITIDIRPSDQIQYTNVGNYILPGSEVTLNSGDVSVSNDATAETVFEFEEPIYLIPKKAYAIAITTSAGQDYKIWTSYLGDFALGTTAQRITKDAVPGMLYRAAQGLGIKSEAIADLKMNIYRAKFKTTTGTAVFNDANPPRRKLRNNALTTVNASEVVTVYHPNHGFLVGDRVHFQGLTGATSYNGILGSNINGRRTITAVDGTGYKFTAGSSDTANKSGRTGGSTLVATQQYQFNTAQINVEGLNPQNLTKVEYTGDFVTSKSLAGGETAYSTTSDVILKQGQDTYFTAPHVVLMDSNEALSYSSNSSSVINANFTNMTTNNYISPVIDIAQFNMITTHNIIDKNDSAATVGFNVPLNWVDETNPRNGSALSKHITIPYTLEQPANGLKILFAAHRPLNAEIEVYYRTLGVGVEGDIRKQNWVKADIDVEPPADQNATVFRNYEVNLGGEFFDLLDEFDRYQVKLVLWSTSSASVPKIRDLRTIALSVEV